MSRIDTALWPMATLQNDLESLMARLNTIPGRVQEWKKSSTRCGADVALSLACVHCKEAREDKLAALKVANTKKLQFKSFMETFINQPLTLQTASTWTVLSSQQVLLLRSEKLDNLTLFALECRAIF